MWKYVYSTLLRGNININKWSKQIFVFCGEIRTQSQSVTRVKTDLPWFFLLAPPIPVKIKVGSLKVHHNITKIIYWNTWSIPVCLKLLPRHRWSRMANFCNMFCHASGYSTKSGKLLLCKYSKLFITRIILTILVFDAYIHV